MTFLSKLKDFFVNKERFKSFIADTVVFFVVFIIIVIIANIFKFPVIAGDSMLPNLRDNQRVIAIATNDVSVGDIVVLWSDDLDKHIIKRVIGVAGDNIQIRDGHCYRNGIMIYESYVRIDEKNMSEMISIDVPEDCIFVMGDNRNHSTDSRTVGPISLSKVEMKVVGSLPF